MKSVQGDSRRSRCKRCAQNRTRDGQIQFFHCVMQSPTIKIIFSEQFFPPLLPPLGLELTAELHFLKRPFWTFYRLSYTAETFQTFLNRPIFRCRQNGVGSQNLSFLPLSDFSSSPVPLLDGYSPGRVAVTAKAS